MLPRDFNDFADSSTILLPPQHHPFHSASQSAHSKILTNCFPYQSFVPMMSADQSPEPIPVPASSPITITPPANNSRKRSHQEVSPEEVSMGGTLPPSRTPGISPTAIYGEQIPPVNPLTGTAPTAETQTGTWFEDQLEMKLQSNVQDKTVQMTDSEGESPRRKVQRRDTSSHADATMAVNPTEPPKATVADPTIDQYTHLLGVGWTHVGGDPGLVAMARGFSRYINNHYPLTDSEILLKSKSLEAYLVKSNQGYLLFPEDLTQGRLVARTWEDTLANLQSSPIRFSWAQPLFASRTPEKGHETDNRTGSSTMAEDSGAMELD